jgi:serine protease inhibitor
MGLRDCILRAGPAMSALLAAAALSAGCGGGAVNPAQAPAGGGSNPAGSPPPAVAQAKAAGAPVNPAIVAADNAFGLHLFQSLISGTENVAISPISVAMALQIVYNGAAGTTQQAMAQTLQLGSLSTPDLNDANAALQASLIAPDPAVQITIANSLWMHLSNNPVLPSFTQTDETYYGATVGDLAGAPDNVNAWVAAETQGLITQILPAEPPGYYASPAVLAVIANTIYFKGQWSATFDPTQTVSAPFTLSDGTQVSAEMMQRVGSYAYLRGANFQAVRLPYGQGRFSMVILLPDVGVDLGSFVAGMTADGLSGWIAQLQGSYGAVALPKFTATYSQSLPPALTSLGMGIAFCPNRADFSGIAAPLSCLADVEHKTVVEVDESGTVATGATTVTVVVTVVQDPVFSITLDRPFLYAIRDDTTGELLFIGILQNPN